MWLITQNGFISLVQDRKDPSKVWVRARVREDIAQHFPAYADQIVTKIGADYIFRLLIDKDTAALAMWNEVQNVDYDSHAKEEMNRRSHPNPKRMPAYYKIWNALAELQPFAPFQHTPRSINGVKPKTVTAPLTFSERDPEWLPEDDDKPFSTGGWLRGGRSTGRAYDWDKHPQSKATGFRNGQPIESYPIVTEHADLDTADLSDITDEELYLLADENADDADFQDLVAKRENEHTGPEGKGKRNPRRRGRAAKKS